MSAPGLAIASRASWGARFRDGVGNRAIGNLERYLHHTVTAHLPTTATLDQERAQWRHVENIGQQRFGAGMSYTFGVFPSGRVYQGASVGRISYHSGAGRNTRGVGIALVGNYDTNPIGHRAIEGVGALLREGVRRGWWRGLTITATHRDFSATACPGRHAHAAVGAINRAASGSGHGHDSIRPQPPEVNDMFEAADRAKLDLTWHATDSLILPAVARMDQRTWGMNARLIAVQATVDTLAQSSGLAAGEVTALIDTAVAEAIAGAKLDLDTDLYYEHPDGGDYDESEESPDE